MGSELIEELVKYIFTGAEKSRFLERGNGQLEWMERRKGDEEGLIMTESFKNFA